MVKLLRIVFIVCLLLAATSTTGIAADIDEVLNALKGSMPHDWEVITDLNNRPGWTRSNETCPRLEFYGPAMGGYRYLDASGRTITEKRFANESIIVWVTPKGFNTGWNPLTRFLNWFAPWGPVEFPKTIGEYNGVRVYAAESYYAPREKWNEDSPKGTVTAIFCTPLQGRTWQSWHTDIQQEIKKLTPTRR